MFSLCWRQHGGSGLGVTVGEALDLPVGDRDWLLDRTGDERQKEARQLERAGRGK